jgi:hypothetical protein
MQAGKVAVGSGIPQGGPKSEEELPPSYLSCLRTSNHISRNSDYNLHIEPQHCLPASFQ